MKILDFKLLIQKLSRLYIVKFLERKVLANRLNKLCVKALKEHSINEEIVTINNRLNDTLIVIENLANIFEKMGYAEDCA